MGLQRNRAWQQQCFNQHFKVPLANSGFGALAATESASRLTDKPLLAPLPCCPRRYCRARRQTLTSTYRSRRWASAVAKGGHGYAVIALIRMII